MKFEISIFLIIVGIVGVALLLIFLLPVHQQKKYNQAMANDQIARAKFMSTFPVEKYGYEKGAIPEFFVSLSGEFIYLNDGTNQDIMYKTDWDGNEIDKWEMSEAQESYDIYFDDDGMGFTISNSPGENFHYGVLEAWNVSTAFKLEEQ